MINNFGEVGVIYAKKNCWLFYFLSQNRCVRLNWDYDL